ncbi:NACHT domain-containing protein [Anabaena catenula]|uniref:NACHT domain-containing protein n=1 Tax=Anabaena catenula FACHB-362 TaxID=2692877 RepID=A0ABR8J3F0_9NOST|nr:NACHT domain-containing protein [Anabaena catenula]MBD2692148.1 NACHT domain-containing protein [Anabaena catenula FACHB-362]
MTGIELLLAQAVSGVAVPIFQSLWGSSTKLVERFGQNFNEAAKTAIFKAFGKYGQNYRKRHGILKVLGMREPVNLEAVYTAVQFLKDDIPSFVSIKEFEEAYRDAENRKFNFQCSEKQAGIKVANEKQYLMVLGEPGAGKSTFLRKMGLEAFQGKKGGFKHGCIPVFIELKSFTSSEIDIEKFIIDEFDICGVPVPDQFTAKALEQGKLLILLDGLDEVPTKNLTEAINQIQNFVDQHDANRFIASCRTAAYRHNFRRFSDVAMADFDDEPIQQFINNWFHGEDDKQAKTSEKCWELLQNPENKAAKELAHTPLLLTFLCLEYGKAQNFSNNRSGLYRKGLRILLEEWASEQLKLRDEIYQELHTELEESLLSEIAYTGFKYNRIFFTEREIIEQINNFFVNNLNASKYLNCKAVLNAIAIQQGILVKKAEYVYSFSHLTLQEYLTAQYIDDHRLVENLVTEHLTDQRWKEVFLLVAGVMRGGADDWLLLMEKEAQKYINTPKLQALLNWTEQVTLGSQGDYKPFRKRASAITRAYANAIAIANAIDIIYFKANININVIANAKTIANAIANAKTNAEANAEANVKTNAIAIDIAKANANSIAIAIKHSGELEKSKIFNNKVNFTLLIVRLEQLKTTIPDDTQAREVHLAFAKRLQQTLLNAYHLTLEMVNLSKEEIKALDNYLYANHLIIQCKDAAASVSRETWEAIEGRMLLPPSN